MSRCGYGVKELRRAVELYEWYLATGEPYALLRAATEAGVSLESARRAVRNPRLKNG